MRNQSVEHPLSLLLLATQKIEILTNTDKLLTGGAYQ
jgi:hypothetical protein